MLALPGLEIAGVVLDQRLHAGWLAADTNGEFSYAHADKNILDVLNQFSQLRSGGTA